MNINDLKKSVSDMSMEELTALLLDVRKVRRTPPAKATSTRTATPKEPASVDEMLAALSPDMKEKLLQELMKRST